MVGAEALPEVSWVQQLEAVMAVSTLLAPHQAVILTHQAADLLPAAMSGTGPHCSLAGQALGIEQRPVWGTSRAEPAGGSELHACTR